MSEFRLYVGDVNPPTKELITQSDDFGHMVEAFIYEERRMIATMYIVQTRVLTLEDDQIGIIFSFTI